MTLMVYPPASPFAAHDARLDCASGTHACAIGRTGLVSEAEKREGDGATPIGRYRLMAGFYRADRINKPQTAGLDMIAIQPGMGWEDDPGSPRYNSLIAAGYPPDGAERFGREDSRYDILIVLDHNAAWPHATPRPHGHSAKPGAGSAIFLHVWNETNGRPTGTAGCVALALEDLRSLLLKCTPQTMLEIRSTK